ncbi:MAG TPA: MBL fold metallo-hydrolase [Deltaproteobacteria bacterium]|nr:MBL fold metallo-hydrolase [Deltaproteobacteria bacterium]
MRRLLSAGLPITAVLLIAGCAPQAVYRSHLLPPQPPRPAGVAITWLGTAGVLVSDRRTGILIDPYVSRFGLFSIGLGKALRPDRDLIRGWVRHLGPDAIDLVAVSHSHFDHAADAAFFALDATAPLIGSASTLNIGRGAGLAEERLRLARPGQAIKLGDFTVTFIESRHGPALFGRIPYPGTIDRPLIVPRPARDYKLGATYAILIRHPSGTILHHGSAGYRPGMYDGIQADVVLLGITGRGDTQAYLAEVPLKLKARMVIPIHFDDFFRPLERNPSFLSSAHFSEFCRAAEQSSLTIRTVPLCEPVRVLPLN